MFWTILFPLINYIIFHFNITWTNLLLHQYLISLEWWKVLRWCPRYCGVSDFLMLNSSSSWSLRYAGLGKNSDISFLLAGATGIFKVENKSTLVVEILEATNLKAADSNGQPLSLIAELLLPTCNYSVMPYYGVMVSLTYLLNLALQFLGEVPGR